MNEYLIIKNATVVTVNESNEVIESGLLAKKYNLIKWKYNLSIKTRKLHSSYFKIYSLFLGKDEIKIEVFLKFRGSRYFQNSAARPCTDVPNNTIHYKYFLKWLY